MAEAIVLIHGAFCTGRSLAGWKTLLEARGHVCVTPTLRHHAVGSEPDAGLATTSVTDYAADLETLIRAMAEPPVVIGHSLGGLLAQMLAARSLVKAAVLLAPATPWGVVPQTADQVAAALGLARLGEFWTKSLFPVFEVAAANSLNMLNPGEQRRIFSQFTAESGRALFETLFWPFDVTRASDVNARDIPCRMLGLTGAEDRVSPPEGLGALARKYQPLLETRVLAGFGHWLIGEPGWEKIVDGVCDWIDATVGD
ncbi:MAG: alpha/beta hydrolase [Alphaproteobacteria bacterium]|nr:alpha/beta hydrolase [Alphaproteobacteria bacterium]